MKYNIYKARSEYNEKTGLHRGDNFAQYSQAYAVTNEDIREVLFALKPPQNAHILTVAGSGDQALHYKMAGVSHIDTFDITFNAKMMMDIKTTAIQKLGRLDFVRLLKEMARTDNIADISQYKKIAESLPADTRNYIQDMRGLRLVRGGAFYETFYNDEYAKLQKLVKEPFNFIWTDLKDLSSHLTQEYDQIYLSNILQYHAHPEYVTPLISDLVRFVKPGGIIMVNVVPYFVDDDMEVCMHLKQHIEKDGIGTVNIIQNHLFCMCVLQKR